MRAIKITGKIIITIIIIIIIIIIEQPNKK